MASKRKIPWRDLAEARDIVARVFPCHVLVGGVFPKKYGRDGPAKWVFDLIPAIAKALSKRSSKG